MRSTAGEDGAVRGDVGTARHVGDHHADDHRVGDHHADDHRVGDHHVDHRGTVLVVSADEASRRSLMGVLADACITAAGCASARETLGTFEDHRPGAVVLDDTVSDMAPVAFARRLKSLDPELRVVLVTDSGKLDATAHDRGSFDAYLLKPTVPAAFVHMVRQTLEHRSVIAENAALRRRVDRVVRPEPAATPTTAPSPPAGDRAAEIDEALDRVVAEARQGRKHGALFLIGLGGATHKWPTRWRHAGEALLDEIERRLAHMRRRTDTVMRSQVGTFVVVCDDVHSLDDADRIAGSLFGELVRPLEIGGVEYRLEPCIGGVLDDDRTKTARCLLDDAALALGDARRGRVPWRLVDEPMGARLRDRRELASAVADDVLSLDFQPVVDLATGEVAGAEARVRRTEHAGTPSMADDIGTVAGPIELDATVGRWVLDRALSALRSWRTGGRVREGYGLWVRLSAQTLADPGFVDHLDERLWDLRLSPRTLNVGVPGLELSGVRGGDLRRLGELGVAVFVDDIGTGHWDPASLQSPGIGGIRIDPELVAVQASAHDHNSGLVRALIAFGHELGLEVTAKGVDTLGQAAALSAMGCGLAVGSHFGGPGPAEQLWARGERQGRP